MQRKTLTLKSTSRTTQPAPVAAEITPTCVMAGRTSKQKKQQSCLAVIARLTELVKEQRKVFIQMRGGAGYCGVPVLIVDGWLTMTDVSIHGTKQTAASQEILIQLKDGSFIAHLHAVEQAKNEGGANG